MRLSIYVFSTCLSLCCLPGVVYSEEPVAEETITEEAVPQQVSESANVDQQLEENKQRLTQPLKLELKAGQTFQEAIEKMGEQAHLKIEFEGLLLKFGNELFSKKLEKDLSLDANSFQEGLDQLNEMIWFDDPNVEKDFSVVAFSRSKAIPVKEGILIYNELVRMSYPSKMITRVYNLQEFNKGVLQNFQGMLIQPVQSNPPVGLINLISDHVNVYWKISGIPNESDQSFHTPYLGQNESLEEAPQLAMIASRMSYLNLQKLLVIKAPRSVHYEVEELLEMIRVANAQAEQQSPPANLIQSSGQLEPSR
ncbi:MAG: hypothetical protein R3C11_14705 [Planctomycetaceae bacterium]